MEISNTENEIGDITEKLGRSDGDFRSEILDLLWGKLERFSKRFLCTWRKRFKGSELKVSVLATRAWKKWEEEISNKMLLVNISQYRLYVFQCQLLASNWKGSFGGVREDCHRPFWGLCLIRQIPCIFSQWSIFRQSFCWFPQCNRRQAYYSRLFPYTWGQQAKEGD